MMMTRMVDATNDDVNNDHEDGGDIFIGKSNHPWWTDASSLPLIKEEGSTGVSTNLPLSLELSHIWLIGHWQSFIHKI